jgi:hypothetical protein
MSAILEVDTPPELDQPETAPLDNGDELISALQAENQYDINNATLYARALRGDITAVMVNGKKKFRRRDLIALKATIREGGRGRPRGPHRKAVKANQTKTAKPSKALIREERTTPHHVNAVSQEAISDYELAYALGHTEAWLGIYADGLGISKAELTERLGTLLQVQARGRRLGPRH